MLNMTATGNVRILKKLDGGKTVNNTSWAHFLAVSHEEFISDSEIKSDKYILKAFGEMADFISRNLNAPRRAFVVGTLRSERYTKQVPITRNIKIGNKAYSVDLTTPMEFTRTVIYNVSQCDFLDRKKEIFVEEVSEEPGEEVLTITEATEVADGKSKSKNGKGSK